MPATTHTLSFDGAILQRGFWLYVWRIDTPLGEYLYVGRTGDNSSPNATPPYQRMGQHLSHRKTQNALRKNLRKIGIEPEECAKFEMVAHGPLFPEVRDMESHKVPRDVVAAFEKALADALCAANYKVLNSVKCKRPLDEAKFELIKAVFAAHFPRLSNGDRSAAPSS